ncbi:hypothetical protein CMALT430_80035 [Carnobacterium maltaromaticum]|nr:hypothetical protein CMALT430_80035 [Carnobacterium maltaromaticum]
MSVSYMAQGGQRFHFKKVVRIKALSGEEIIKLASLYYSVARYHLSRLFTYKA